MNYKLIGALLILVSLPVVGMAEETADKGEAQSPATATPSNVEQKPQERGGLDRDIIRRSKTVQKSTTGNRSKSIKYGPVITVKPKGNKPAPTNKAVQAKPQEGIEPDEIDAR